VPPELREILKDPLLVAFAAFMLLCIALGVVLVVLWLPVGGTPPPPGSPCPHPVLLYALKGAP
jgi:hypothetical protein